MVEELAPGDIVLAVPQGKSTAREARAMQNAIPIIAAISIA